MTCQNKEDARLLRRRDVIRRTNMTRYMIDELEAEGLFPARVKIGKRSVFWSAEAVDEYIERQIKQSRLPSTSAEQVLG
ncbi:helix-turn-helix transcriptional regulator [Phenylobacterium conjunctum]|uniref:Helix-turn-helix transcriptional regulator n=1 Tax=Phenylobacterium conjunctum TaxID=1298959 RepID=A0ABW3T6C6_9CAUL